MIEQCECPSFTPHPDPWISAAGNYSVHALLWFAIGLLTYHCGRLGKELYTCLCRLWPTFATTHEVTETESDVSTEDEEEQVRLARAVKRAMEARRLERVRFAARAMANILPAFLLVRTFLYRDYLWKEITPTEVRDFWREVYPTMLYGSIVSTVWQAAPCLVTPRQVDIAHVLGYFFVFLCGTVYRDNEVELLWAAVWMTSSRTLAAVILGNFRLVSVLNISLSVANMVFFYASGTTALISCAFRELWACATILVLCKLVDSSLLAEVRSAVEARNSSQAESTVHSLLSAMCDAVVQVGVDLQIQRPAPRLACLLLMRNTVKNLQGSNFAAFLAEADRNRFTEIAEDQQVTTRSLNVHLRDEFGSLVGVRTFLARCPANEEGETCQLIGVSLDEEPGVNHVPERNDTAVVPLSPQHESTQKEHSVAGRSFQSVQYESSVSNASDESLPLGSARESEVAVWIDPEDTNLPVVACTAGFTVVCGPASPGDFSLVKAMANKESFMNWFTHCYNAEFHHHLCEAELDDEEKALEPLDVILMPQSSCQKSIGLTATCVFSAMIEEEDRLVVKLTFQNLKEVVAPRSNRRKPRGRVRDVSASELPRPSKADTSVYASNFPPPGKSSSVSSGLYYL